MSPKAFRLAWERVRQRAGLEDLHFHDLRHEALSRFFEMGLTTRRSGLSAVTEIPACCFATPIRCVSACCRSSTAHPISGGGRRTICTGDHIGHKVTVCLTHPSLNEVRILSALRSCTNCRQP